MSTYNPNADFVSTDTAALASHMRSCAHKKSRLFGLQVAMERLHTLVFPRLLTVALVAMLVVTTTSIV